MSANSAVTVLRSPSRFSAAEGSATRIGESFDFFAGAAAAGAPSAVPHSPQKRLPAGLSAPHFGQRFASAAPQSPQNFLPAGFSVLQFGQRIDPCNLAEQSDLVSPAAASGHCRLSTVELVWPGVLKGLNILGRGQTNLECNPINFWRSHPPCIPSLC